MKQRSFLSLFIIIILLFFGTTTTSLAHSGSMGFSVLNIEQNEIQYELFLDQLDLFPQFGTNLDNLVNEEQFSQKIESYLQKGLRIDADSKPLKMELLSMNMANKGTLRGVEFHLKFTADKVIEKCNLHYDLAFDDVPAHTSGLLVHAGEYVQQDLIDSTKRDIQINLPQHNQQDNSDSTKGDIQNNLPQPKIGAVLWKYFKLGIEHILTGYDHLVFLLSLVLIASRYKDALKIVTAFTIAHSITLFLVASGRIHVISSWVEALIAVTICYVAVENMFVQKAKWRWVLTAIFGLIHGMGFAGALAETGLPKGNLIGTLLTFNLGVETGQLMVLCLLLPLLIWLRKFPWYRKMMISTSCLIFVLAFYWLIQRL
ncbi:HupE/UreJ family protein [Paenibacillus alginolyticus]|uniref:HupE/UreJ family protein n=1 Tax=Paenibacillus alginolyticus TaxID=59839 RepID=A0ABT4GPD3_9BACL|nr:HupE/UreJ family protein [Paenibacillus alginolyticus]MCY9670778.1 HupE/UreJ family protein [Paenibacillus alginolyticus]MCY9698087.1 HupE/UreJ family protein [Paenibacillus alginolyticus]MEC0146194.1 HupE/UreJ family protein [Paenibacillus alginolyticus]